MKPWVRTSSCILHPASRHLFPAILLCSAVACACCKRGSYFSEVGKWILLSPNYSACRLPPDFEEPGCLGNITGCCCGNSASLTTGFPCCWAWRWVLSTSVHASRWQEMALPLALSIKLQSNVNSFAFTYWNLLCCWLTVGEKMRLIHLGNRLEEGVRVGGTFVY